MRFLLMFLLGIGVSLCLRQESLPSTDPGALVRSLWLGPIAQYGLLLPFFCALLCLGLGLAQSRLLAQPHLEIQKNRLVFSLRYLSWFSWAAFCLGVGIAALDTRATDLPRFWGDHLLQADIHADQLPSSSRRWVYGKVEGLPKTTESRDHHSGATVMLHRFQFKVLCWLPLERTKPSRPDTTPIHSASVQYIALQQHGAFPVELGANNQNLQLPWGRRGCKKPSQAVPSFWRHIQISMSVENDPASSGLALPEVSNRVRPGQWAWLPVKLDLVRGQLNPGAEDFNRWAFVNRLSVRGRVLQKEPVHWLHHRGNLDAWRNQASVRLRNAVADYPAAQRLLPAVMLGDRRWLTTEDWRDLNSLGLGHLVAISGLHIGFAAAIGYFIGFRLLRWLTGLAPVVATLFPLQIGAWFFAWVAGLSYSALSGFALPTVRALMALTLLCVWRWRFTQLPLSQVWVISAAVLLAYSPRWLFDISFLLSFGAVGVLIWCMTLGVFKERAFTQAWRLQWGLSLGLSPLNVAFFHQVTWLSPFVNFFAIPLFSFLLVPLLALSSFFGLIWPLAGYWLLNVCAWLVEFGMASLSSLAALPEVSSGWMLRSWLAAFALLAAFVLWLWPRAWRTRFLAMVLLIVAVCHESHESIEQGGFRMTVLDVGQGLAIALETQTHLMIYDPGPAFGDMHQVDRAWLPFLSFYDQAKVDLMVVSHGDADHAGSALPFLEAVETDRYMTLAPMHHLDKVAPPFNACQAGEEWMWDEVHFEVLFPDDGDDLTTRNISCVIKVTGKQHSVLLTGDIDRDMEANLLKRYASTANDIGSAEVHPLASDILLVPHHGSKTSSSTGLINHVAPSMAIVSHGYNNRFGHPHAEVKSRYLVRDVQWLSTATAGAITILSSPVRENLSVNIAGQQQKFWRF